MKTKILLLFSLQTNEAYRRGVPLCKSNTIKKQARIDIYLVGITVRFLLLRLHSKQTTNKRLYIGQIPLKTNKN